MGGEAMSQDVLGELLVNVALDGTSFQKGVQGINQQLKLVQSDFRAAGSKIAGFGKSTKDLETKIGTLTKQIGLQNQKVGLYRDQIDKTVTRISKYKAEQEQLKSQISDTKKVLEESTLANGKEAESTKLLESQVKELESAYQKKDNAIQTSTKSLKGYQIKMNNTVGDIKNLQSELTSANKAFVTQTSKANILAGNLNKLGEQYQTIGEKMQSVGENLSLGITAPVVAGLGVAVKSAIEFDKEMQTMRALLDDGSVSASELNQQVGTLGDKSREWAAKYGVSISSVNEGMTELIKRGYSYNQVIGAMPSILDAARASGDDFNTVMHTASSVVEQFGLKANDTKTTLKNTKMVTDELTFAANKTAAGFSDMGTAMEYVGPVAHAAGIPLNDVAAAIGLLSNRGIEADKAGTTLRAMITKLVKPTKAARGALKEMGVQVIGTNGKLKPLGTLINDINDKTKSWTSASKNAALVQIFGRQSLAGVVALMNQGGTALDNLSAATIKSTGYTKKLSDQMGKTAANQFKQFQVEAQVAGQKIGEELIPEILPLIHDVGSLINAFSNLSPAQKSIIVDSALVLAALGPLNFGIGTLVKTSGYLSSGIGATIGKLAGLRTAEEVTAASTATLATETTVAAGAMETAEVGVGVLGGALEVLTGPVGLVIAAVGALGLGIYAFNKASHQMVKVSLDTANSMIKQHDANAQLIDSLGTLRNESNLTNNEFATYVDLQGEIKKSTDPATIKELKNQMAQLQQKSGLSNTQLQKMVDLNKKITDKIPQATAKITEEGNHIADTTNKLKGYNSELSKNIDREFDKQLTGALSNESKLRDDLNLKQQKLQDGLKKEEDLKKKIDNWDQKAVDKKINELYNERLTGHLNDAQLAQNQHKIALLEKGKEGLYQQLGVLQKQDNTLSSQIQKDKDQLGLSDKIIQKADEHYFKEAGLNYQKGRGVTYLNQQIAKQEGILQKLHDSTPARERVTADYKKQVEDIQRQIDKLEGVRDKVSKIDNLAGKHEKKQHTIIGLNNQEAEQARKRVLLENGLNYQKGRGVLYVDDQIQKQKDLLQKLHDSTTPQERMTNGYKYQVSQIERQISKLNGVRNKLVDIDRAASHSVTKDIYVRTVYDTPIGKAAAEHKLGRLFHVPGYATGTDNAPGGVALVGEQGPELVNLPKGSQVIPNGLTEQILAGFNAMPKLATGGQITKSGTALTGEKGRELVVGQAKPLDISSQPSVLNRPIILQTVIDKQVIASATYKSVNDLIKQDERAKSIADGEW